MYTLRNLQDKALQLQAAAHTIKALQTTDIAGSEQLFARDQAVCKLVCRQLGRDHDSVLLIALSQKG